MVGSCKAKTYSKSRTLPRRPPPAAARGLSSSSCSAARGSSDVISCCGRGVTNGLSSFVLPPPRSIVTYSNGLGVVVLRIIIYHQVRHSE